MKIWPNIFNRFWRSDKSRTRALGGAGLGLAISRQLVEAQGGQIEAQNLPEAGLKVTYRFTGKKLSNFSLTDNFRPSKIERLNIYSYIHNEE